MQLLKSLFCIVLLLFLICQVLCQVVRFPNYGRPPQGRPSWTSNDVERCSNGRSCEPWNRCPPSRRPRYAQRRECFYSTYSRRIPGVCCLNERTRPPFQAQPPINPPVIVTRRPLTATPPGSFESGPITMRVPPGPPCGISQTTSGLVIGGSAARQGVWPWMVALTIDVRGTQQSICTGFLIDRRHFLSAAHCFDNRDPEVYRARIGNVNRNEADEYGIQSIAIPDGYTPGLFYDDIAVVELSRDVDTPDFMPVCLPSENMQNLTGRGTTVAGWGATRVGGPMSVVLQQLHAIPVVSPYNCNRVLRDFMSSYNEQFPRGITDTFICAGFPEGERDSCGGDSGGPLMYSDSTNGRWYAVGVVSFGVSCALPGIPGGYTRITSYLGFIRRNT